MVVEGDFTVTRELKLALIVGFSLVLAVTVLISDHLSKARQVKLAEVSDAHPAMAAVTVAEPPAGTLPPTEEPPVPLPPRTETANEPATPAATDPKLALSTPAAAKPEVVHLTQGKGASGIPANELKSDTKADPRKDTRLASGGAAAAPAGPRVIDRTASADPDAALLKTAADLGHSVRRNGDTTEIVLNPGSTATKTAGSTPGNNPTSTPAPGEKTYVVVDGDNFTKVAKKLYGDGGLWKKLAEANSDRVKGDSLRVGMKLRAPSVETLTGKAAAPSLAAKPTTSEKSAATADHAAAKPNEKSPKKGDKAGDKSAEKPADKTKSKKPETSEVKYASYTVKKGDTLGTIAQRTLGSSTRADELVKVNSTVLEDVDNIPIGAVIKVPQS